MYNIILSLTMGDQLDEHFALFLLSSSSSSLFVQIKIHDANKERMIKPEQDSKVEKTTLTAALE